MELPNIGSGVYAIFNPVTKCVYVGETLDFTQRIAAHLKCIYGKGYTNFNLKEEKTKTFEIFTVIDSDYDKKTALEKDWLIQETIVMYIFRKHGFTLYNGNDDYEDNTGLHRDFLIDKNFSVDDSQESLNKLYECLAYHSSGNYKAEEWKSLIEDTENYINALIAERLFGDKNIENALDEIINEKNPKDLWQKRIEAYEEAVKNKAQKNLSLVNKSNYNNIRSMLLNSPLSAKDLEHCALKKMEIEELIKLVEDGKLDRAVFHKFGAYVHQGPLTILSVKSFDLHGLEEEDGNRLGNLGLEINPEKKDKKICLWALKNLGTDVAKRIADENAASKEPMYVIMPYARSGEKEVKENNNALLLKDGESLKAFYSRMRSVFEDKENPENIKFSDAHFPYGFTFNSSEIHDIPKGMFPPVVDPSGKENTAFLISELYYINAYYESLDDLYRCYYSMRSDKKQPYENLDYSLGIIGSVPKIKHHNRCGNEDLNAPREKSVDTSYDKSFIRLKGEDDVSQSRKKLIDFLRNNSTDNPDNPKSSFVIAEIEYPYVVTLATKK